MILTESKVKQGKSQIHTTSFTLGTLLYYVTMYGLHTIDITNKELK